MTLLQLYVPDALVHRFRRTYPHGDIARFLRAAMNDAIKEQEAAEERARWAAHDRDRGSAS